MARKLSKGRDIPKKEKIEIARKVCELYATGDYTIKQCLQENGVKSDATWSNWRSQIEEIRELYNSAKQKSLKSQELKTAEKGVAMLDKWIEGIDCVEEKIEYEKRGNKWIEVKKTVVRKKKHSLNAALNAINRLNNETISSSIEDAKIVNFNFVTPARAGGDADK